MEVRVLHRLGPLVLKRYPAVSRELEGVAVRLDTNPTQQDFPNQD